jgi:uncharacterized coiled-coil protein SlyX
MNISDNGSAFASSGCSKGRGSALDPEEVKKAVSEYVTVMITSSKEELTKVINESIANYQQQDMTTADVQKIVSDAIAEYAAKDITTKEIKKIVSDAISSEKKQTQKNTEAISQFNKALENVQESISKLGESTGADYATLAATVKSQAQTISALNSALAEAQKKINELDKREVSVVNNYVTEVTQQITNINEQIQDAVGRLDYIEGFWSDLFMRGVHAFSNQLPTNIHDVRGGAYELPQGIRCYVDGIGDIYYAKQILSNGNIVWEYTGNSFKREKNQKW